ncbi:hypothetical protein [Methylicorpusculum sp.]|uniref:hypothetical protein n=1 Tax=Methylicorpusculum sp. TaxID=2713644 RepID=UPI002715AF39|nr:hypothetical protein [Methylicorpusculum sp.]MDO8846284.1 hypothetical protein [Methylicorpusculum sp.]MDP3529059.1 hypothetical protein [Methylicorpusculum sp.]MDZ4154169.1 hypothetical protein [Methylicorpusculum sp.]
MDKLVFLKRLFPAQNDAEKIKPRIAEALQPNRLKKSSGIMKINDKANRERRNLRTCS